MKVGSAEAERICARPDPAIGFILLYGPDQGLVAERRRRLIGAVLGRADDPFRLVELEPDRVVAAPGLLVEEAQALSLVGGRRVVLLRQATDMLAKAIEGLLKLDGHEALVLVEAGELGAGSSLRRLAERDRTAAAIACYRPDAGRLRDQIGARLRELGLTATPEAMDHLAEHLGSNRELTRAEIDKLALYRGADRASAITAEEVAAVVGNSSALAVDGMIWATLLGRPGAAEPTLERLLGEGQAPVRLVRALAATLYRLLPLAQRVAGGEPAGAVVGSIRPPVHFSQKAPMERALGRWRRERLEAALARTVETERLCKRGGSPDRLLLRHLVHELALAGAQGTSGPT